MRVCVDDESRLFRLGDDDFAILLTEGGRGKARQVAAGLRATVERMRFFPQQESAGPQVAGRHCAGAHEPDWALARFATKVRSAGGK